MLIRDFLFLVFLWIVSSYTPYKKVMAILLFGILVVHSLSIIRMYLTRRREPNREGVIRPGHIISRFEYAYEKIPYIMIRHGIMLLNGYPYFHTGLVVEHNGKVYVMHYVSEDLAQEKKGSKYSGDFIFCMKKDQWYLYLEPIPSFLENGRKGSCVSIVDIGKPISYDEQAASRLTFTSTAHCSYFIGKYLEEIGVCQNKSLYPDFIYYSPESFRNYFGNQTELQL